MIKIEDGTTLRGLERILVLLALQRTTSIVAAARELGVGKYWVRRRIHEWQWDADRIRRGALPDDDSPTCAVPHV